MYFWIANVITLYTNRKAGLIEIAAVDNNTKELLYLRTGIEPGKLQNVCFTTTFI